MFKIICVTNRRLCTEELEVRMEKIAQARPYAIMLREKDISEQEYEPLAARLYDICLKNGVKCIIHSFPDTAVKIGCGCVHIPLPQLRGMTESDKSCFDALGTSCHSLEDVREAERLGCTYAVLGHIFETDCKKNLKGRGLDFLANACSQASIPIYAIGGIAADNIGEIRQSGADGACIMSGFMRCDSPTGYIKNLHDSL